MKENYFSQFKQDRFINEVIFSNKKFGFFIDLTTSINLIIK